VWLDRLFRAWYAEARLITLEDGSRYVPDVDLTDRPWVWAWDPPADIDPVKTSQAQQLDLQCGATTLHEIWRAKGLDLETAMDQQADALGMTKPQLQKLLAQRLYGSIASTPGTAADMAAKRLRPRSIKKPHRASRGASRLFGGIRT
jgi:hypothetical protein